MTVTYLPPDTLRKSAFDLIQECRDKLEAGTIDMSGVESSVRNYCESIAQLPLEEGMLHKDDLTLLMAEITKLGEELIVARDTVQTELGKLERMRKASVAYQHSDGITPKTVVSNDGE